MLWPPRSSIDALPIQDNCFNQAITPVDPESMSVMAILRQVLKALMQRMGFSAAL
jgi:hypothetical protein